MADDATSVPERSTLKQLGLRACGTCVKAKIKCVPNPQQNRKCQRCQRLDKQCEPAVSSTRKRAHPQHVIQLEKKLDDLVNLLSASKGQGGVSEHAQISQRSPTFVQQTFSAAGLIRDSQPGLSSQRNDANSSSTAFSHHPLTLQPDGSHFNLPSQKGPWLLLEFRTSMAHQFPFVVIPTEATSECLRKERPMLWKAILTTASCLNPLQQEAMGRELVEEFSTRLLLKAEKSLDLLQALLIYLAWCHYHCLVNPQLLNLMSLAKALVANLGYHKTRFHSILKERPPDPIEEGDGSVKQVRGTSPSEFKSRALEERRALAGCFFLSVVTYTSGKKIEPLPFTPHLKECCERLLVAREYESDELLVQFVAIQHIALKISGIYNEVNVYSGIGGSSLRTFINSMQGELDSLKRNLPLELQHHPCILTYYQSVEISLYEIGLSYAFSNEEDKTDRLRILYSLLHALKTFFSTHFTLAYPITVARAFATYVQIEYAIRMGIKLLRIPSTDGWDSNHARSSLEFRSAMEIVAGKIEAIIQVRSRDRPQPLPHDGRDIFVHYQNNMKCLTTWSQSLESSNGDLRGFSQTEHDRQGPHSADCPLAAAQTQPLFGLSMMTDSDKYLWEILNCQNDDWLPFGGIGGF